METTIFQLKEEHISSDEIIIAAFKTMNLQIFEEILDDDKKYEAKSKWVFLAKLRDKFNWFKEKGDTELTIKPGRCGGWCNEGEKGFSLTGNNSGKSTSYLIIKDEKQAEIIDLIQCSTFIDADKRNLFDDNYFNPVNPLAPLKDYLVVTELEGIGYVIGSYDSIELAKEVSDDLFKKYYHFQIGKRQELFEKMLHRQTYKVNASLKCHTIQNANQCSSDGVYSVAVIGTNREGFSLKKLILDREKTIYAYKLNKYIEDKKRFVSFFPNFIAN